MPFARVLRKGQMTLPKKVRDVLKVSEGDVIDFEITGSTVIMRHKVLVEKEKSEFFANLSRMHEKIGDVDPAIVEKAIEEAIRDVRRQAKTKKK
ncbi:MAG: AbrB/MazE/SpoVT family DNA-binding domain-containing protein [Syntrophorhabdaceae bacterium]|nr:AbrB/MazE/SpoVT family DNA-binding domain-containing protein [Syntrophorhabdaceae bacterium]